MMGHHNMSINIHTVLEHDPQTHPEFYAAAGILSRISATIAKVFPIVRDDSGLISFSLGMTELTKRVKSDKPPTWSFDTPVLGSELKNMFKVFSSTERGKFLPAKTPPLRFKRGVPLFLAAFKEYTDIPYSAWDLRDPRLSMVIDKDNLEVIKYYNSGDYSDFDIDHLKMLRIISLTSGAGEVSNDNQYKCNLTGIDKVFDKIPKLARFSILQTWDYRPNIANDYLIRNFNDIDKPAGYSLVPLVADTILLPKVVKEAPYDIDSDKGDVPW